VTKDPAGSIFLLLQILPRCRHPAVREVLVQSRELDSRASSMDR